MAIFKPPGRGSLAFNDGQGPMAITSNAFSIGAFVEVHSLQTRTDFNGLTGTVLKLDGNGNVLVELQGGPSTLKPVNLKLVEACSNPQGDDSVVAERPRPKEMDTMTSPKKVVIVSPKAENMISPKAVPAVPVQPEVPAWPLSPASPSSPSSPSSAKPRLQRPPAIPLRGVVQHYAWGKPSDTSIVAHMATEQVRSRRGTMRAPPLMRGMRFAELWMGTHTNGHSSVLLPSGKRRSDLRRPGAVNVRQLMDQEESCTSSDDEGAEEFFLGDVIQQDPVFWLGEAEAHRKNIPFLLKVLSVNQALSVQAHPNKALAEELHRTMPGHYPDDNHKPEICIPIGHFEALCGFRPIAETRKNIHETPELQALIALNEEQINAAPLSELFSRLMNSNKRQQAHQVVALVSRLKEKAEPDRDEKLIIRIAEDYPTDVGIFSVYFLNYVVITADMPNRFIFCAADEPHAYLCGDAIECMALSDNVVRAGLTSKFKDVDTLLRMMTWRDDLLDELVNVGERISENVFRYNPPVDDFLVYEITGPVPEGIILRRAAIAACISGDMVIDFKPAPLPSLLPDDVTEGADLQEPVTWTWKGAKKIRKGHTLFSRAGTQMVILSADEGARLFIATY